MFHLHQNVLINIFAVLASLTLIIYGLIVGKSLLAPLIIALLLALALLPFARYLQEITHSRAVSAILPTLGVFIISLVFLGVVTLQVNNITEKWSTISETTEEKLSEFKTYLTQNTPIESKTLDNVFKTTSINEIQEEYLNTNNATYLTQIIFGAIGSYLLTFIYLFFILLNRSSFKKFLLSLVKNSKEKTLRSTLSESMNTTIAYLYGKTKLIGLLIVIYSIGLGISGVDSFILIAVLASFLTLIPYIGNIIAFLLAVVLGYLSNGETFVLVGIIITFSLTQFIESYILQPYVIGHEVQLNPFFVILAVIVGNTIWGVTGMILAIPLLAILNVFFLKIKKTHSLGKLLSN